MELKEDGVEDEDDHIFHVYNSSTLPMHEKPIDWRDFSMVSPVRDMTESIANEDGPDRNAFCSNSYAFAVTELVESANAIERGFMSNYSVQ